MTKKTKTILKKGERIYKSLKPKLEKNFSKGDFVAIETESGKFFVGKTSIESVKKAKKEFPKKQFFLAQVGRMAGILKDL